jgi:hypothetical protein
MAGKTRMGKVAQSPEEAMKDYLKKKKKPNTKLGGREMDPTKIPGFKFGEGTE